jgi:hypothetical protein
MTAPVGHFITMAKTIKQLGIEHTSLAEHFIAAGGHFNMFGNINKPFGEHFNMLGNIVEMPAEHLTTFGENITVLAAPSGTDNKF